MFLRQEGGDAGKNGFNRIWHSSTSDVFRMFGLFDLFGVFTLIGLEAVRIPRPEVDITRDCSVHRTGLHTTQTKQHIDRHSGSTDIPTSYPSCSSFQPGPVPTS